MDEWNEIIKEFLLESDENLAQLDRDLIELESNPTSREILARIFRTVHTIKGSSGFFSFTNSGIVAHAGENLLSQLRDGKIAFNSEIAIVLLSLVDAIGGRIRCSSPLRNDWTGLLRSCRTALPKAGCSPSAISGNNSRAWCGIWESRARRKFAWN